MIEPDYVGVARNHSSSHENRIHNDEIATKYGFAGALVPGVAVFGLTSIPLTRKFGAALLHGNTLHTRFLKPAYHNDELQVRLAQGDQQTEAQCSNTQSTVLCTLRAVPGSPAVELPHHNFDLNTPAVPVDRSSRPLITWDAVHVNQPFAVTAWHPTAADNARYAGEVDDDQSLFAGNNALVHPHLLLAQANTVLVDHYEMPAWIHVGSEMRLHQPLKSDTHYRIFAQPVERWERKGHQFIRAYIAYELDGQVITEIYHTAIFNVGDK